MLPSCPILLQNTNDCESPFHDRPVIACLDVSVSFFTIRPLDSSHTNISPVVVPPARSLPQRENAAILNAWKWNKYNYFAYWRSKQEFQVSELIMINTSSLGTLKLTDDVTLEKALDSFHESRSKILITSPKGSAKNSPVWSKSIRLRASEFSKELLFLSPSHCLTMFLVETSHTLTVPSQLEETLIKTKTRHFQVYLTKQQVERTSQLEGIITQFPKINH